MGMSPFIRSLRSKVGHHLLHVPAVSVLTFDDRERVLLVRTAEGNKWTTPGGMIEPLESPADAAVREMWEETGLHVELTRLIGVFGGPLFSGTYDNGDEVSWVGLAFEGRVLSGELAPDGRETLEARYFTAAEIEELDCRPHAAEVVRVAFDRSAEPFFAAPTWEPTEPVT